MDLCYGDRISIDDPLSSGATRAAVEAVAGRFGLLVGDTAPVTPGMVNAGTARIIVTRTSAQVPGCPDWSAKSDANFKNATSTNYGCASNANLAAMVADPEHLLKGASGPSRTVVMSGDKAMVARAQGVGPKLAQRIVNELKDKVGGIVLGGETAASPAPGSHSADAVSALLNLGFRPGEASAAVAHAERELGGDASLDALVRTALRKAAR
jgi:hypothetical protein